MQRRNFALYFCGYPRDALDTLAIGDWRDTVQLVTEYLQLLAGESVRAEQRINDAVLSYRPSVDETWYSDARCRQISGESFFPGKGGSTKLAQKVCAQCVVREQCLQFAIDHNITDGVWGGLTPADRQKERVRRKALSQET